MSRENRIWLIVFLIGAAALLGRAMFSSQGMAKAYVHAVEVDRVQVADPDADDETATKWISAEDAQTQGITLPAKGSDDRITWTRYDNSNYTAYSKAVAANQTDYQFSPSRTIGTWIAALFTLFVLSFLIRDNPLYKVAESLFIGISAAYWMVVQFWDQITPNLIGNLSPTLVRNWAMPGLGADFQQDLVYIIPGILGIMLLWRLAPKGGWISRWPMAFFIGTFCGLRLVRYLQSDFLTQIRNSIEPLYVKSVKTAADGSAVLDAAGNPLTGFDVWDSLANVILIIGVLSCLVYFFFSFEHKGIVGKTAKLGIWFLMITFGAAFGYTVMGRIALLAIRLEFLFDDWLWLIDPTDKRVEAVVSMLGLY
ncbi:MAG: hypothetical protein V3T84_04010 [Phycisphaerales bacterium]